MNQYLPASQRKTRTSLVPAGYRLALPQCEQGSAKVPEMTDKRPFDDLGGRIQEALRNSPAQDLEKNLRALLASWFDRMDLVLREDFEVQKKLLERAEQKLVELENRLRELESRSGPPAR